MNQIDDYLETLHEGKKWEATKKFLDKHKGKFIAGAAALAVGSHLAKSKLKKSSNDAPKKEFDSDNPIGDRVGARLARRKRELQLKADRLKQKLSN